MVSQRAHHGPQSLKVFGAPFFKRARFGRLFKSRSSRTEGPPSLVKGILLAKSPEGVGRYARNPEAKTINPSEARFFIEAAPKRPVGEQSPPPGTPLPCNRIFYTSFCRSRLRGCLRRVAFFCLDAKESNQRKKSSLALKTRRYAPQPTTSRAPCKLACKWPRRSPYYVKRAPRKLLCYSLLESYFVIRNS